MGHLNFYQPETDGIVQSLEQLILPHNYQSAIGWARSVLASSDLHLTPNAAA